jgi:uncharacterized membrane protein
MLFSNQRRNNKSPLSWNDLHELTIGRGARQCARLVPLICGLLKLFGKVPAMDQTQAPVQCCPDCATQMPGGVRFCPGCGRSMQVITRAQGKVGMLSENLAGALAYFTILPAILFLFVEPYRKNIFVRFHALQCFLYTAAIVLLGVALRLTDYVLFVIPVLGPLLVVVIDAVAALAAILLWCVLVAKAWRGEIFKIPLLGDFAERYAGEF